MRFRPCIDLHQGQVKQIVGATLSDAGRPTTNFVADHPPSYFAELYRQDDLTGGHIIMLGPGNEDAATEAVHAFPQGLQIGGGITAVNAPLWLERGAGRVIVTSYVFRDGQLYRESLEKMVDAVGRERLVLDLSCAFRDGRYVVMTDRWQQSTNFSIDRQNLEELAGSCGEFLIHATAVEGKQEGVDAELIRLLGDIAPIPTTYAGGVRSMADVEIIERLGQDRLDFTVGSALDIFGGRSLCYREMVSFNSHST
jgi:phosphoribosylformimino-5-aminoimidazole carboxamide ribotide isomerase